MSVDTSAIEDVFNEPGCGRNDNKTAAERTMGCTRQLKPGEAGGGCAFDGAKIALQPFTDVAHLVHGPIACEGNSWDNRGSASSGSDLWRRSFTTDMNETDVIFGGEKRLYQAIGEVIGKFDPPAVFVYQTCVPAAIGDDIKAVCKAAVAKFGKPIIPVNSPGFVGSKNLGNKLAGEALLEHVIGTEEPDYTTPYDINIIGEYNLSGEFWQIKPLLDELGIRILSCISGDGKYHELACSHRAKAAMLVCSKAMINVARKMEERYGIPYFEGSFYGVQDSSNSLRTIARMLIERGAPLELGGRTEAVIMREEARVRAAIERFKPRFKGKKVLLITGGVKSWSVVAALQEAGLEIAGTSVKKSTKEDKDRIKELMGRHALMIEEAAPRDIYKMLMNSRADMMLSGGKSQFVALKAMIPWLDINQERSQAYMGYIGMVKLMEEIDKALYNPIWTQLRRPAPWDEAEVNRQTNIPHTDSHAAENSTAVRGHSSAAGFKERANASGRWVVGHISAAQATCAVQASE
ncbi:MULTISPECIES: nitrogenase iron-molybdenum cofactor biosynthesis protein NifE [Bradyrhizobium]|uniref:Nitrogenase iron-molybdenum cofactor biosynthesis protein NifE n=3 Tax=Bradyrhizobium TaxID=374 RepID=A0A410VI37_9BRAD|nr:MULTISPECIES: nitrogenase iron-molybdenum cofactor biosynthesis protein NifE [Bradyrhizobium]MCG2632638.1 nitrogenase iron-molybdenum cofactor biosynthesis protein NifE [Bradyrhizobium zhengyangense]MCG2645399.1 nitrogenase iron-molybdenum cofactor biosynthesis protein NifE [Bradyrhizobium zhengyangense]MCG2672871.1 nitrogenase iron-molybdenum cofactor biosynthesis protein NifE [Bradyrhizobium zhengyangense]MDN4985677.1 nitrogenase iron-molybdenum cofactor biosynthesis protein NifE [Bradyrhi